MYRSLKKLQDDVLNNQTTCETITRSYIQTIQQHQHLKNIIGYIWLLYTYILYNNYWKTHILNQLNILLLILNLLTIV